LFRISGVLFALPVNTIGRILKKTEIMPVENAGEFIRGKIVDPDVAIGSGGPKPQDYLPVVDMYRLCGLAEVEDKTHALVIVDDGGSRVGLFTGPVQQISETAGAGKQEISTVVRTPGNSFLSTTLILPDGVLVHLLDSPKLLRQIGLKVAM
jgi:chemotaxis signal transduction protein